jgi:hypothetical protein
MKQKMNNNRNFWQLLFALMVALSLWACQKDTLKTPIITEVVNYEASPNDTLVETIHTGQWVVLKGENLSSVSQVYFCGYPAVVNSAYFTDNSIVVQVPSISFQTLPEDMWNIITVINESGGTSFTINIIGPPHITHIRNYAAAPNDTITGLILPGQSINIIGYNLKGASSIIFQGVEADLSEIVYTDSSAVVRLPDDFAASDLSKKNTITYTTSAGSSTYKIPIIVPLVVDPLLELLTGGVGPGKTWVLDFDAEGKSSYFLGPIYFAGDELRWELDCASDGGNCWTWFPEWQTWMPGPADYGTMTFSVDENGTFVKIVQEVIGTAGTFEGNYSLDAEAKILTFGELVPLNMGMDQVWSTGYLISLNQDAMQIGFMHTDESKHEMEIYNYIVQK